MKVGYLCTVRTCHAPLAGEERRFVCSNGHAFDIARSGYVNLLQPQDRRSRTPGDSPDAVAARRRFLDAGIMDSITEAVVALLPLGEADALLDVGCGEGTQLAAFRRRYRMEAHGIDLSVPAIELAARRHRDCHWAIVNADRFLPFRDHSFAALISITARMNPAEFRRVLASDGWLLLALPGADDLIELRETILGNAIRRDRTERTVREFEPLFTLDRLERIRQTVTLEPASVSDVMTSSYRGLRTRERERLASVTSMEVTLSRDVLLFR